MGLDVPQCYSAAAGIIRCKRRWLEGSGVEVEDSAGDYVFLNGDERFYFFIIICILFRFGVGRDGWFGNGFKGLLDDLKRIDRTKGVWEM